MAPTSTPRGGAKAQKAGGRKRPPEAEAPVAAAAAVPAETAKNGVPANVDSKIEALLRSRSLPGRRAAVDCKVCWECGTMKDQEAYSGEQWGEKTPVCTSCEQNPPERKNCETCGVGKTRNAYSAEQWAREGRVCMACFLFAKPGGGEAGDDGEEAAKKPAAKKPAAKRRKRISPKKKAAKKTTAATADEPEKPNNNEVCDSGEVAEKKPAAKRRKRSSPKKESANLESNERKGRKKRWTKRPWKEIKPTPYDAEPGEDGLPPKLDRAVRDTPAGRIATCLCRDRDRCADIMWRYARLGDSRYVNYLRLPQHSKKNTAVGKHATAYREALLRHLGYSEGDVVQMSHRGGKVDWKDISGNVAYVHFHPDAMATLLEGKRGSKQGTANKWRLSLEVGQKLGLMEEDKCPAPDSNKEESFFALPTYTLEQATRDVERAEEEYKRKYNQFKESNDWMETDMATSPAEYVKKLNDLRRQREQLLKENEELHERMKREAAKTSAAEKKTQKLLKGLDKMANRLDRWESISRKGRTPSWLTNGFDELVSDAVNDASAEAASASKKKKKGSGGRRWSDQRMDKAVEAKWQDPTISHEDALRIGGFEFPPLPRKGGQNIVDSDGVSISQRKNNLMRRLRNRSKEMAERAGNTLEAMKEKEAEPEDEAGGEEQKEGDENVTAEETAAADRLVADLTGVEVSLGGFRLYF